MLNRRHFLFISELNTHKQMMMKHFEKRIKIVVSRPCRNVAAGQRFLYV